MNISVNIYDLKLKNYFCICKNRRNIDSDKV